MEHEKPKHLGLPAFVSGRVDVSRLLREVEAVDEFLNQAAIRQPGTSLKLPRTSRLLDEITAANGLNLLVTEERHILATFLRAVKDKAPVIHMSFSADPSPLFIKNITTWLRREIHPMVLLQVGLQPNIGAGCIIRTTNKHFDLSLKQRFIKGHDILARVLKGVKESSVTEQTIQPARSQEIGPVNGATA